MLDWLRNNIIGPIMAALIVLPPVPRYTALVALVVAAFYVIPWWWIVSLAAVLLKLSMQGLALIVDRIQRSAGNRSYNNRRFDAIDRGSEIGLNGLRWGVGLMDRVRTATRRRPPLQKRWLVIVPLLVLLLVAARPQLGNNDIGRALDNGFAQMGNFERWALAGRGIAPAQGAPPAEGQIKPAATLVTPSATLPSAQETPLSQEQDTIHEVQPGEILRKIALQYGVSARCIMQANAALYPRQNWDALRIGQKLVIPTQSAACRP